MKITTALAVVAALSLSGCGVIIPIAHGEDKLNLLSLGDSRDEVRHKIGDPDTTSGGGENGATSQIDTYKLYRKGTAACDLVGGLFVLTIPWWMPFCGIAAGNPAPYWIQYVDGKLVQWGKAESPFQAQQYQYQPSLPPVYQPAPAYQPPAQPLQIWTPPVMGGHGPAQPPELHLVYPQ